MLNWLRRKLGYEAIMRELSCLDYQTHQLRDQLNDMQVTIERQKINSLALGRIIAKLDPSYGQDYNDPNVRAESDKLGQRAITTLIAEENARRQTLSEPLISPDDFNYIQR